MRVKMQVSIASSSFSYQPGEVVDIEDVLAKKWVAVGHAQRVSPETPLTDREINLRDIDAAEALTRGCEYCHRRGAFAIRDRVFCHAHYRAMIEL